MYFKRNYFHGVHRIGGTKRDFASEVDTIPAMLQAGEAVIPRPYTAIVNKFLEKQKLPLPMPEKVEKVMSEFKHHKLHDSHGKLVKDRKQAIAIALNVARHQYKK